MSMLSVQCDEMRWLADNLAEHDSHMDEYVQAMRSAADTIWELRNKMCDMVDQKLEVDRLKAENAMLRDRESLIEDIEKLKAENAKLQEERDEWHRVAVSKQDIIDHMRDARAENAKLREAVATAIKVQAVLCGDADSLYCRNKCPLHRPESNDCLACDVIGVAQELGVEVTP